MIDAVNSSLVATQALRNNTEQLSSAPAIAPTVTVSETPQAPKAPYISPYIAIDTGSNKAVLQIRDSETGDVTQQFPTKSRLAQLSQLQARQANEPTSSSQSPTPAPSQEHVDVNTQAGNEQGTTSIITVQDITATPPSNISIPSPQIAAAALSAGAQSTQTPSPASLSVSV